MNKGTARILLESMTYNHRTAVRHSERAKRAVLREAWDSVGYWIRHALDHYDDAEHDAARIRKAFK